jgi:hypothetical protein
MTGYFIESLIMSVAIQFNCLSTNGYKFTTFPAPSFFAEGKAKGVSPHF